MIWTLEGVSEQSTRMRWDLAVLTVSGVSTLSAMEVVEKISALPNANSDVGPVRERRQVGGGGTGRRTARTWSCTTVARDIRF